MGSDKFEIIGKSQIEHSYLFPENIKQKKGCEGQYQTIWFVQFKGEFNDIKINTSELSKHEWFRIDKVIENMMYPEQKESFKKVLQEFEMLKNNRIF